MAFLMLISISYKKIILYGLYLSAFLLPLEDLTTLFTDFTLIRFIIIIIFAVWLLQIILHEREPRIPKLFIPLVLFNIFSGLSYFWSFNTSSNISSLTSFTQLIIWLVMTVDLLDDEKNIKTAARFYILGSIVASIMALVLLYSGELEEANRIAAIEGQNPNGFSRSVGLAFVLLLYSSYSGYFIRNKLINFIGIILTGITIILAVSRGTYVAIIISILLIFFGGKTKHKFSISISFILLFVILFSFYESFITETILPRLVGFEGLGGRQTIWTVSLTMIKENLLGGVGFGNFPDVYGFYSMRLRGWRANSGSHNVYIRVLAELGVTGLFLFLLFHYLQLKDILRKIKNSSLKVFLLAFFAYLVVGGMSNDLLLTKYFYFGFALIISLLQIDRKQLLEEQAQNNQPYSLRGKVEHYEKVN